MYYSSCLHPGGGEIGGMGGQNPMVFGKANSRVQIISDTGVIFDDVDRCDSRNLSWLR